MAATKKRQVWLIGLIGIVVVLISLLIVRDVRVEPKMVAGVDCTSQSDTQVLTFFYKPGSPQNQLRLLINKLGGSQVDSYASSYGYSISVPSNRVASAAKLLQSSPIVSKISISPAEGCLDPD